MNKRIVFLILFFQLLSAQQESEKDIIILKDSTRVSCRIEKVIPIVIYTDDFGLKNYKHADDITEMKITGFGEVINASKGYIQDPIDVQNYLDTRVMLKRKVGISGGGGIRMVDYEIQKHMSGYGGPIFACLGVKGLIPKLPLSIDLTSELGIGGSSINDNKEIFYYHDLKLSLNLNLLPIYRKMNIFISGGLQYISATIEDNVDEDCEEEINNSSVNFHEGLLEKSVEGIGPCFDIGLIYNINKNIEVVGAYHMTFINLDFTEFECNALESGVGLKLFYYITD